MTSKQRAYLKRQHIPGTDRGGKRGHRCQGTDKDRSSSKLYG